MLGLPVGEGLGAPATGYEIHHGRTVRGSGDEFLGGAQCGAVFGTMWHGSLEGDLFRSAFLAEVAAAAGRAWEPGGISFAAARERRLDLLGDLIEQHLDLDALLALARDGVPDLPVLPPGVLS